MANNCILIGYNFSIQFVRHQNQISYFDIFSISSGYFSNQTFEKMKKVGTILTFWFYKLWIIHKQVLTDRVSQTDFHGLKLIRLKKLFQNERVQMIPVRIEEDKDRLDLCGITYVT